VPLRQIPCPCVKFSSTRDRLSSTSRSLPTRLPFFSTIQGFSAPVSFFGDPSAESQTQMVFRGHVQNDPTSLETWETDLTL